MAVFGHSGSQAPQLMHSLVMTVATDGAIPSRRRGVQTASGPAGDAVIGDDGSTREEETLMRRLALVVATGLVFAVGVARAQEHPQMEEAKKDLQAAKTALDAESHDNGGHRKQASGDIDRALGHIRAGPATIGRTQH